MITALLALAAFVTAIVSGVLGMAGGVALIGLMTAVLPPPSVVPLHGMVQLFANGSRALLMLRDVRWREAIVFLVPLLGGVLLGALFWRQASLAWLEPVIGVMLLLFVGWRRLLANRRVRHVPLFAYALTGFSVGLVMLFIGATGPMVAPVFRREDWTPRQVIASMAVVQTLGHLLKLPAFLLLGFDYAPHVPLLALLLVCSFVGTYVGRHVLDRLDKERFALVFDIVLAMLALLLLAH